MEELRKRLFFVFGAILVYRIGTYIPVPGINPAALASFFEQQSGTIIDMFNMFSGGALERFSILFCSRYNALHISINYYATNVSNNANSQRD